MKLSYFTNCLIIVLPIPFPVLVSDLVNDDFLQLHIEQILFSIFLPFFDKTSVIFFDSVLSLHFTQYIFIIITIFNFITVLCYKIILIFYQNFITRFFPSEVNLYRLSDSITQ